MFKNIESFFRKDRRNLMIVAHPDDEIIFGGSSLQNGNWDVICVTNGEDKVRSLEFEICMKELDCNYEHWNFPDVWGGDFDRPKVSAALDSYIKRGFDNVVTHNSTGEYGHSQHIALHHIVSEIVKDNLFVFDKGSNVLPYKLLLKKLQLLSNYKSQYDSFDWVNDKGHKEIMDYIVFETLNQIK